MALYNLGDQSFEIDFGPIFANLCVTSAHGMKPSALLVGAYP